MTSRAKRMNGTSKNVNSSGMIPEPPDQVVTISDNEQLAMFVSRMQQAPYLAVDTEFQRERTYYPELCLVQVAGLGEIGLIDVPAIDDLSPLTELVGEQGPLKAFHAADQDVEVLYQTLGIAPAPLFDTQVAAALTGRGDQLGYARLIEDLTGTTLPKTHTRTDWTRRPLSQQALAYAADDVRYLAVVYPMLKQELQASGRLAWAEADSAALIDPSRLTAEPESAWQRIRSWHNLDPAQQQVLAELAQWREQQAMRNNRPRKWIISDDALLAVARIQPDNQEALQEVKSLPQKTAKRHGQALLAAIARGAKRPAKPLAANVEPLTDAQKQSCKNARRALAICAQNADIPAPLLARRKELEQAVLGERDLKMLSGWRTEVAGRTILDVIEGRRQIVGGGGDARIVEKAS